MYEIRKRSRVDKDVWFVIATADTWKWANEIARSLDCASAGEFCVFKDGEIIRTWKEANGRD